MKPGSVACEAIPKPGCRPDACDAIGVRAPIERRTIDIWPAAARVLGISRGLAYGMAKRGELPTIRVGRRLLVPIAKLNELLGERAP